MDKIDNIKLRRGNTVSSCSIFVSTYLCSMWGTLPWFQFSNSLWNKKQDRYMPWKNLELTFSFMLCNLAYFYFMRTVHAKYFRMSLWIFQDSKIAILQIVRKGKTSEIKLFFTIQIIGVLSKIAGYYNEFCSLSTA